MPHAAREAVDSIQHLTLTQLLYSLAVLSLSNPLGLNLVALLEGGLQPVEVGRRPCAAVVVPVHERPDVLLLVVEDGGVPHAAREAVLDQVLGQGLLPVERRVARAVEAEPEPPEIIGMSVRVFSRKLDVDGPRTLRVEVRPRHIVNHQLLLIASCT